MKKIVIVGAGFGGIHLAKALRNQPYEVLLIDRNNYHSFLPLLYQVATGGLEANSITYPVRRIFRGYRNVQFQMAEVLAVVPERHLIETSAGEIAYDYLVLATGSMPQFFNLASIRSEFLTLKSVPDALDLRSWLMQNLERAAVSRDEAERAALLNIAIIGGGPTGIELAGALAEMKRHVLPLDFPQLDFNQMSVTLFEAQDRLLGNMSSAASAHSLGYLRDLGVDVRLRTPVADYVDNCIYLTDAPPFPTQTVIWTAGVQGAPVGGLQHATVVGGRVLVDATNRVLGLRGVYAIGDVAACPQTTYPKGLPMLAPVAIQQGRHLAANLVRASRGEAWQPFQYRDQGVMATIGRHRAVVDLPHWRFQGAFAWFVWMAIHLMSLVGFRNKLIALIDWANSYWRYDRPLGLIIRPLAKRRADRSRPALPAEAAW